MSAGGWSDKDKARIVAESLDPAHDLLGGGTALRATCEPALCLAAAAATERVTAARTLGGPGFVPVLLAEGSAPLQPRPWAGWRLRSARRWCGSGPMWTPRRCGGCSRWCRACRDRGSAGGADPLGGAAGRFPQGHGWLGRLGAAGAPRRPVRGRGLHLPPQADRPGENPGL